MAPPPLIAPRPSEVRWTAHGSLTLSPRTMSEESGVVSPEMVAARVPEQILHEDEIVLILAKPSILFIFYSSFLFVLGTLLLGILVAQVTAAINNPFFTPYMVALVTVSLAIGRLVWALLVWTSHIYMLTNRRILTIKGVINVHMFQANLRKIQKTDLFRPVVMRALGTGTIAFSTAAAADNFDSTWVMIARPVETQEQIAAAINKSQSR